MRAAENIMYGESEYVRNINKYKEEYEKYQKYKVWKISERKRFNKANVPLTQRNMAKNETEKEADGEKEGRERERRES